MLPVKNGPWASIVTYGVLADGSPVFSLSTLAAHGRNLQRDQRASLAVSESVPPARDPADTGRVTVAGVTEEPSGDRLAEARAIYEAAVASAAIFGDFADFHWWVLKVERVRWVGGFGRMDSVGPESFAAAEADPVAPSAPGAIAHLNADHADSLLLIAKALSGHTDAEEARCVGADRYGLDLELVTARGRTGARVGFAPVSGTWPTAATQTVFSIARARSSVTQCSSLNSPACHAALTVTSDAPPTARARVSSGNRMS